MTTTLSSEDVLHRAGKIVPHLRMTLATKDTIKLHAIPRGGIPALYAILAMAEPLVLSRLRVTDTPQDADVFVDDIIDSGRTMKSYCDEYPGRPFYALVDKTSLNDQSLGWVVFPWEGSQENGLEDNIVRMLQFIGEDPTRGGLVETPHRVAAAWRDWCSGYTVSPADVLKTFEDGAADYDEMVLVKDIPFYSHCEHHMAPFFGTASVAYIPQGRIVGLSKVSRLVDVFAKRLQVQERLTNEIVGALMTNLLPKGAGVLIKARHLCMESRGVRQQGHVTITCALRGAMKDDAKARSEFLSLTR
jgi:GTP cyclohydrolase I